MAFRRDIDPVLIDTWINQRISEILDSRMYWSGTLSFTSIPVDSLYSTGRVSLTKGSDVVTGSSTGWPVSDLVNTTLEEDVQDIGYVKVQLGSISRISPGTWLLVGEDDSTEAVPVVDIEPSTSKVLAKFSKPHSSGESVVCSSLTVRQFRLNVNTPVYDVKAVVDSETIWLNSAWAGPSCSNSAYEIVQAYISLPPDCKNILDAYDAVQGIPIVVGHSYEFLLWADTQRSSYTCPVMLSDAGTNESGVQRYEIWPWPRSAMQIGIIYVRKWPDLKKDSDIAPPFIPSQIIVDGAIADALNYKRSSEDVFHNPNLAQFYEARYREGLNRAIRLDEERAVKSYQQKLSLMRFHGGIGWDQAHIAPEYWPWP